MRWTTIRRRLVPASATLAVTTAALAITTVSPASADVSWTAISSPLPADAVPGQGMSLLGDSCPVDGWCVAVGNYPVYKGTAQSTAGLVVVQTGGTSMALEAPLPNDASAVNPQAVLQSVSCPQIGWCLAVGSYLSSVGVTSTMVDELANDVWIPLQIGLPAMANGGQLSVVTCVTSSWCAAGGFFTPSTGGEDALVDVYSSGRWTPTAVPMPSTSSGSQVLGLSCPAAGACVATVQSMLGPSLTGATETLSGGVWSEAPLPLPAGASPLAGIGTSPLPISCPVVGTCVVAGTAFDGTYWGFLDTLSGGTVTSVTAPLPNGAASTDVQLTDVSCADAGYCSAVGFANIGGVDTGLIETAQSGPWTASTAPAPAGATASAGEELFDVSCPADALCVADGQSNVAGTISGVLLASQGASWSAVTAPLPGDAAANPDPSFAPLSCPAMGACIAAGTYLGASGRSGVVEVDPSLAPTIVAPSTSLVAPQTVQYSASVTGNGRAPGGTVAFSSGEELLCSAAIFNGTAACAGPLGPGTTVVSSYSGDAADAPSWGQVTNPYGPTTIVAGAGTPQTCKVNKLCPTTMVVGVVNTFGTPVPGVAVTFTAPKSGASGTFQGQPTSFTSTAGYANAVPFQANGKTGCYIVTATAPGVPGAAQFALANSKT